MREASFENEHERSVGLLRCRQMVHTMIPEVIAKVRQRARRDVNNDDYDESADSGP